MVFLGFWGLHSKSGVNHFFCGFSWVLGEGGLLEGLLFEGFMCV